MNPAPSAPWTPYPDPVPADLPEVRDPGPSSRVLRVVGHLGAVMAVVACGFVAITILTGGLLVQISVPLFFSSFVILVVPGLLNRDFERARFRLLTLARRHGWALRWVKGPIGRVFVSTGGGVRRGGRTARGYYRDVHDDPIMIWYEAQFPDLVRPGPRDVLRQPDAAFWGQTPGGATFAGTMMMIDADLPAGVAAPVAGLGVMLQVMAGFRCPGAVPGPDAMDVTTLALQRIHVPKVAVLPRDGVVWVMADLPILSEDAEAIAQAVAAALDVLAGVARAMAGAGDALA